MTPYYEQDGITIYHGDCRKVLRELNPDRFGVLLTDPPFGISYKSGARREGLADHIYGDEDTQTRDHVLDWWGDRPALVFGTWRIQRPRGTRARLIWDTKGALGMGDLRLPWKPSDQEIYVLGEGFKGRRDSNVIRVAPVQSMASNGRTHPHEKPVTLLLILLNKCPVGEVIDPCVGSGSTLVAAKRTGRKAIGIEIDERYCEIAAKRLAQGALPLEFSA